MNRVLRMLLPALLALTMPALAQDRAAADRTLQGEADVIMKDVEKYSTLAFKDAVPCKNMTRQELADFFGGMIDADVTERAVYKERVTYELLGLLEKGVDLKEAYKALYGGAVAGFYDPEIKEFRYIDTPAADKDPMQRLNEMMMRMMTGKSDKQSTMAHELYHALQDQRHDLLFVQKRVSDNADESGAVKCAIEGGASVVQWRYMFNGQDDRVEPILTQMAAGGGGPAGPGMENVPRYLKDSIVVPYTIGFKFMWAVYKKQGFEGFNAAHHETPTSLEQILHPEKFFAGEHPTTLKLPLHRVFAESAGWEKLNEDTLGEFDLRLLLSYNGVSKKDAERAAAGWQGDRFWVYEQGGKTDAPRQVLVHVTTWDSENDAAEFFAAYQKVMRKKFPGGKTLRSSTESYAVASGDAIASALLDGTEVVIVEGLRPADGELQAAFGKVLDQLEKKPYQRPQIAGFRTDEERENLKLFENKYLGAELPVSAGWQVNERVSLRPDGPIVMTSGPNTFSVTKVRQEGKVDMKAFAAALPEKIGSRVRGFKMASIGERDLGERTAVTIVFTAQRAGATSNTLFHMTFARTSTYIFIYTGLCDTPAAMEQATADFDRILDEADME